MKRILKVLILVFVIFINVNVYAASRCGAEHDNFFNTYSYNHDMTLNHCIKLGETVTVFKVPSSTHVTCEAITNCTSNYSNVEISYNSTECKATGVKPGKFVNFTITCLRDDEYYETISIYDPNSSTEPPVADDDLYNPNIAVEANCSTLGELRKDLDGIFSLFKIVAPILAVIMSVYDFIRAVSGKVEGEMKKAFSKLMKRMLFALILFFLPSILDFFLGLVDSGYSTCINS